MSSSHKIKISVQVQPQQGTYEKQRAAWIAADELGVDVIFNWDHFYPLYGEPDGAHFEAYTLLAAMAEVTERAQIGSLVTCNSYRNPNLLADMSRTIDHISGGRFILGIGSGWAERDYFNYGYEFGTAASRLQDLARDLPIIEDRFAKLNPGPVNGSIPILIGGDGAKVTLRLVAKHARIWHAFGDVETITRKSAILADWCAKIGRDPQEIERSTGISKETQSNLDAYIAAGVTHFTIGTGGPDFDLGLVKELVAWRDSRN
ncbi:MAG TPA: LLM class F420-dependent oxidoreductase [Thermomicrobiales bacterium]|nr:LLM class F420-dependent oxidoreductase [Thermomicrobiales bacterium]